MLPVLQMSKNRAPAQALELEMGPIPYDIGIGSDTAVSQISVGQAQYTRVTAPYSIP